MAEYVTCPMCCRRSYNINDIRHRFCGNCGFHENTDATRWVCWPDPSGEWVTIRAIGMTDEAWERCAALGYLPVHEGVTAPERERVNA